MSDEMRRVEVQLYTKQKGWVVFREIDVPMHLSYSEALDQFAKDMEISSEWLYLIDKGNGDEGTVRRDSYIVDVWMLTDKGKRIYQGQRRTRPETSVLDARREIADRMGLPMRKVTIREVIDMGHSDE